MPRNSRANMHTRSSTVVRSQSASDAPQDFAGAITKSPVTRPTQRIRPGALNVHGKPISLRPEVGRLTLDPERELAIARTWSRHVGATRITASTSVAAGRAIRPDYRAGSVLVGEGGFVSQFGHGWPILDPPAGSSALTGMRWPVGPLAAGGGSLHVFTNNCEHFCQCAYVGTSQLPSGGSWQRIFGGATRVMPPLSRALFASLARGCAWPRAGVMPATTELGRSPLRRLFCNRIGVPWSTSTFRVAASLHQGDRDESV